MISDLRINEWRRYAFDRRFHRKGNETLAEYRRRVKNSIRLKLLRDGQTNEEAL